MGVTSELARFVVETDYKDMPTEAIAVSKQALLDGLGCALAGSADVAGKIASDYARSLGGNQEAGIIGSGFAATVPEAAMVNGTMAHALDYDDVCRDWNGHPTVVLLPVLLALGEKHRLSGKQALAAYVLGVEIGGRVGAQFFQGHYQRGFHSTATLGALAAAAAASKLLDLDVHRTVMALGIAGSMAAGLRLNFGSMTKPFHAGNAARNGIVSAMLAQRGFTADENIIDGSYGYCYALGGEGEIAYAKMAQGLGQPFEVIKPGLAMKPYPCCRAAHRCIDGMLALVGSVRQPAPEASDRFTAEDVEAVECVTSDWIPRVLIHVEPKDGLQGKFSMQYLMARAILDGAIRLAHFTDEKVLDPKSQVLMRKVKFVHTPDRLGYSGRQLPEIVRVKLRDGRQMEHAVGPAKGDPSNPMSKDELVGKYRDCAELALPPSDIERSLEMVLNLERLEDVGDLSKVVSRRGAAAPMDRGGYIAGGRCLCVAAPIHRGGGPGSPSGAFNEIRSIKTMIQPNEGTTALAGVRVVEAGRYIAAPFCGIILADLGAEVVKLEEPGRGDETRNVAPYNDGESIYFVAHNRNKKSITLDMRKPDAKDVMKDIARNCDIFIENFRPGVMQEMGVGYEELSKANPALVFVSISGFGQTGPYAPRPGFEQIAQAVGGMMYVTGFPENPPVLAGAFVGDYIGGLYGAIGALAALNQARATGKGQWVDAGLLDGIVSLLGYHMGVFKCTGTQWGRCGNTLHFSAPLGIYPTKEGYVYINVGADNLFRRFARTIGRPGPPDDERFKDRTQRVAHRAELDGIVSEWTSGRTTDEVVKVLNDAALPCGPVNDLAGVADDPQVAARDLLLEVEQASGVKMPVIGRALKMSESPAHIGRAPVLGESNDEFYGGLLGYDAEKLARLKESGTI